MRYSLAIASLFVAGAICKPVADPAVVHEVIVVEVTTTCVVYGDATSCIDSGDATPAAEPVVVDVEPPVVDVEPVVVDVEPVVVDVEPVVVDVEPPVVDVEPVVPFVPESYDDVVPQSPPESPPENEPQQVNSPPVSGSPDGDLKSRVLFHHNMHRTNHNAIALEWSEELASFAAQTAQSCVFEHDSVPGGGGYGQNIGSSSNDDIGGIITNRFYNDELELFSQEFGRDQPATSYKAWGHFTQMVWKETTQVGAANIYCEGLGYFSVYNYLPAGNFQNEYAANVDPPNGDPLYIA